MTEEFCGKEKSDPPDGCLFREREFLFALRGGEDGRRAEEEAKTLWFGFALEENELVFQHAVEDTIGETCGEVGRTDRACPQVGREFKKAAFCGYLDQVAEIGEPMTEIMQLIRKSDHTRTVD